MPRIAITRDITIAVTGRLMNVSAIMGLSVQVHFHPAQPGSLPAVQVVFFRKLFSRSQQKAREQ